jgi:hypothetical protein
VVTGSARAMSNRRGLAGRDRGGRSGCCPPVRPPVSGARIRLTLTITADRGMRRTSRSGPSTGRGDTLTPSTFEDRRLQAAIRPSKQGRGDGVPVWHDLPGGGPDRRHSPRHGESRVRAALRTLREVVKTAKGDVPSSRRSALKNGHCLDSSLTALGSYGTGLREQPRRGAGSWRLSLEFVRHTVPVGSGLRTSVDRAPRNAPHS